MSDLINVSNAKVLIEKVVFDSKIYPRLKPSTATIDEYTDALASGATFPPIVLEKDTYRLLDGYHRWKAYQKYRSGYQLLLQAGNGDKPPAPPESINVVFHTVPDGVPAKLYALSLSAKHGLRLQTEDKRQAAREAYQGQSGCSVKVIAQYIGVRENTVRDFVKDLIAEFEETRQSIVHRLDLLGWTQDEIANQLKALFPSARGVSRHPVGDLLHENGNCRFRAKADLDRGVPVATVAKRMNIPETLAWAIRLQDRTDIERFATVEPEIKIQPFNGWHFQKCHDLFGADYPGRIPGELVAHAVYLNSEPGDLVIDPMVGSGTTLDVCLVMGRHCYGYDLVNAFGRPDVLLHDFVERGWPERTVQAKLIFWDPPYYKKKDAEYTDGSISRFSRDDYLQVFDRAARTIPPKFSGRLAFLCSDYDDEEDPNENVFFEDYIAIFKAAGWKRGRRTQAPLSPQQVHPDIVNKFRLSKGQARISRDLIMFHHE